MKKVFVCGNTNLLKELKGMVSAAGHQLSEHLESGDVILQNFCGCCPLRVNLDEGESTEWMKSQTQNGSAPLHQFVTTSTHKTDSFPWVVRLSSSDDLKKLLDSQ